MQLGRRRAHRAGTAARASSAVLLLVLVGSGPQSVAATPPTPSPAPGGLVPTVGPVPGEAERPTGSLVLLLDASGSMAAAAGGGRTRIEVSKDALTDVVRDLPDGTATGLRVYGDTVKEGPAACSDTRLLVPVAPLDRTALSTAIAGIEVRGETPIAASLRVAAGDLPVSGPRSIVLVSDGEESCGGDPCAAARELATQGVDLRVDVIGLQVDPAAREQLTCVASAGRGTYYDAADATSLSSQLRRLSARAARAYQPAGTPVVGTPDPGTAPTLTTGQYLDTVGETPVHYRVAVGAGTLHVAATVRPTTPALTDDERLRVSVLDASGQECASQLESAVGAFSRLTPLTSALVLAPDDLAECAGPVVLRVQRQRVEGSTLPLEVVVVQEPEVVDPADLPPEATPGSYDLTARTATGGPLRVVGSPSFSAAPAVGPGRYTDAVLIGETLLYRVDLDWGQQAVCDVTMGAVPALATAIGPRFVGGEIILYGPTRRELEADQGSTQQAEYEGSDLALHAVTPPVRYLNREGDSQVEGALLPGPYYCALLVNGDPALAVTGEVPVTVTVDVVGTAGRGAPAYQSRATPLEPSASATAPPTAASDDQDESGGLAAGQVVTGLAGLGAVVAVVAALLRSRRRARARTTPAPPAPTPR